MTEPKHLIRDPLTPWTAAPLKIPGDGSIKFISIRHPSYPDSKNEFFCFRAFDFATDETVVHAQPAGIDTLTSNDDIKAYDNAAGIHHGTVAFACFLVAGNQPGILSPSRISSPEELASLVAESRLNSETWYHGLLKKELYYYYTNDYFTNQGYNIITDFRLWEYPSAEILNQCDPFSIWKTSHDNSEMLPPALYGPVSDLSSNIKARDGGCRLTGTIDACDVVHIIPEMHKEWWYDQGMRRYCGRTKTGADPTFVPDNLISLRKDVRYVFDQAGYCFTVKTHSLLGVEEKKGKKAKKPDPTDEQESDDEGDYDADDQGGDQGKRKHVKEASRKTAGLKKRKDAVAEMGEKDMKAEYGDEADDYRQPGELIRRDMPKDFFNIENDRSKFNLNAIQEDIVDRVIYYPGCEKAFELGREYMGKHPEVRAVSDPQGPWMEAVEDESDNL
ncbi:hypothetical protein Dda_4580 [Drechslerella dactyloides]|uniref:HNH nuclease domain-containing protein n=1 Tax=Drechslerella dactyloides TaxID=74499 RepID=A0AAD6IX65_DREDA|nr:hypothetical protein Dda_4580 [Drechslerella dactyloides]